MFGNEDWSLLNRHSLIRETLKTLIKFVGESALEPLLIKLLLLLFLIDFIDKVIKDFLVIVIPK